MKKQLVKILISAGMIVIFSGLTPFVFCQNTGKTVKLVYNYPSDRPIKYLITSTMAQIMDIQGQSIQTDVTSAFGCSVKNAGNQDKNLKLEITIDTLGQTTNSPMGSAGGAIQSVKGKTCNIIVSLNGKVVDISDAANISYVVEGSGETNMIQNLSDFFQLLPDKPVTEGEIWNLTDSVLTTTPSMKMKTLDNSVNKLEGFETINGIECAKISSTHSGLWSMSIQNPEVDLYITGPYTGTSECFFDVKEGYHVKLTATTKMAGNLEMTSPQAMTMPITIEVKAVTEVK